MATINPSELDLLEESVIKINRTAKVTSRGKRFRFSALVAIGDGKGQCQSIDNRVSLMPKSRLVDSQDLGALCWPECLPLVEVQCDLF